MKQRLIDISDQNWHDDISTKSKLELYCKHKTILDFELYLSLDIYWKHRVALSRFRCGNHKLAIERDRYLNFDRSDRLCQYCKNRGVNVIENEVHFLLVCPMLENLRKTYLTNCINSRTEIDTFIPLLSSKKPEYIKNLAAFLYHAFKQHREINMINEL